MNKLEIIFSNISSGYFEARVLDTNEYKLKVEKDNKSYIYTIHDYFSAYPLQLGNGTYRISLYKHVKNKEYALCDSTSVNVILDNEFVPYLCPNQYVDYLYKQDVIDLATSLSGQTNTRTYNNVRKHMRQYGYDYIRALTTKLNQLPDITRCINTKLGICQDLAALTVALLRINKIPAKFVIGYYGKQYHAWTSVYINKKWILYDPTREIKKQQRDEEYTVERWY